MKTRSRLNMPGFKLPHIAPFNNNKDESSKIKNPKTAEEQKMAEARKALNQISQKPLLEPKPLHPNSGGSSIRNNGVVGSSGSVDPFDVDYSGVEPVDLGTIKLSDEGRAAKGFRDEFGNYMGREFRGNDERLGRITAEQNYKEAMGELREKYFDLERDKLRLIPTDDAEMQDEEFKSKLKPYQLFNPEMFSDQKPKNK